MDICLTVVFVLNVLVWNCQGCTIDLLPGVRSADKDLSEPTELKVYYSDIVLFGKSRIYETVGHPLEEFVGIFTVRFDVLCSYKGGKLPDTIFVVGTGNMNDAVPECPRVPVNMARDFYQVMFLKRTRRPDVFEAEFKANEASIASANDLLSNLTMSCGLDLDMESAMAHCYNFLPVQEGCKRYTPPMFTSRPVRTTTTQRPTTTTTTTTTAATTTTTPPSTTTPPVERSSTTTTTATTTVPTEPSTTTTASTAPTSVSTPEPTTTTAKVTEATTTVVKTTGKVMLPASSSDLPNPPTTPSTPQPTQTTKLMTSKNDKPMTSKTDKPMTSHTDKSIESKVDKSVTSQPNDSDNKGQTEGTSSKPEPGAKTSHEKTGESEESGAGGTPRLCLNPALLAIISIFFIISFLR